MAIEDRKARRSEKVAVVHKPILFAQWIDFRSWVKKEWAAHLAIIKEPTRFSSAFLSLSLSLFKLPILRVMLFDSLVWSVCTSRINGYLVFLPAPASCASCPRWILPTSSKISSPSIPPTTKGAPQPFFYSTSTVSMYHVRGENDVEYSNSFTSTTTGATGWNWVIGYSSNSFEWKWVFFFFFLFKHTFQPLRPMIYRYINSISFLRIKI